MAEGGSGALTRSSGSSDPLIGRVINGRFKVTALIARGGMGKVYRAEQAPLGRACAVKVLNPNYAGEHDPEFHKRFFLEASIASKLTHPNTVTIFDYGKAEDDLYYMAMEYLEGQTLHRAIREAGFFPDERASHVARQICRALREAHALGVIHRDLKPANIFLVEHGDESDFVKVLDFGLVKNVSDSKGEDLTQTGLFMGSPKYMAPEQIRGDRVDARTDIYALGVILYEMLTGKVPFDRANSVNILMAHVNEDVPPLRKTNPQSQVGPELEHTVMRCMAKSPSDRFASMDEVLAALKRAAGGAGATISGMGTGEYRSLGSAGASGSYAPVPFRDDGALTTSQPSLLLQGVQPSIPVSRAPPGVTSGSGAVRPPSKGLIAAILLGGAVLAALAGAWVLRSDGGPEERRKLVEESVAAVPSDVGPRATEAPAAAPPSAASAEAVVSVRKVRIATEPEGASVRENGVELCGQTPCDITYRGADAEPTKDHTVVVAKAGHRSETRVFRVSEESVTVKLAKVQAPPPPPPPRPAESDKAPPGYKADIPY